jgi:hypothetical protein
MSFKKVMKNMSAKAVNLIHSVASPEELSEEVYGSKVTGRSSSSAAADLSSGMASWCFEEEGTLGSAS